MPDNTQLSAQAADFLSTLESGDYPKVLVDSYPRIMNAIVDALSPYGITHIEMPATPEAVWRAIRAAKQR